MKIGLDLQPCFGNRSGIGMLTYEYVSRLHNDPASPFDFEGRVFNFRNQNDISAFESTVDFPVNVCSTVPYRYFKIGWEVCPFTYDTLFGKTDLNIFFNYIIPPRIKGNAITFVYDVNYLRFPETTATKTLYYLRHNLKRSIQRADQVLTISDFSKNEILNFFDIDTSKVTVIPCAPSIHQYSPEETDRSMVPVSPYILYVGTIEPRKNIVRMILSYELLRSKYHIDHKLVLAGGKGWNDGDIKAAIERSAYRNDIILTGYVSEQQKYALYQHADVFWFLSIYEGFGIPILEAMHFGCPVVCSTAASLPEVAGDAALLADPSDIEAIASQTFSVLEDPQLHRELIRKGYDREKMYSWDSSADQLLNVMRTFI